MSNVSFLKLTLIITPGSLSLKPERSGNPLMSNGLIFFFRLFHVFLGWRCGAKIQCSQVLLRLAEKSWAAEVTSIPIKTLLNSKLQFTHLCFSLSNILSLLFISKPSSYNTLSGKSIF